MIGCHDDERIGGSICLDARRGCGRASSRCRRNCSHARGRRRDGGGGCKGRATEQPAQGFSELASFGVAQIDDVDIAVRGGRNIDAGNQRFQAREQCG